jgi:molybdenum cofactor guanylyltransferase
MSDAAAIVLAGGRSSRMGAPKAELEWHGSTLLRRVTGLLARSVNGPVIVVGAPEQELPPLPATVSVVRDAREGRGPMQGLAAGMAAVDDRAEIVYVSSTDVPLLHPAFVRRVLSAFTAEVDVVLPLVGGYRQPLAAGYRVGLLGAVQELVAADRLRPGSLFERCRVRALEAREMLADARLAFVDPRLASVSNLNDPADYEAACALPPPQIQVETPGGTRRVVAAWSLGELSAGLRDRRLGPRSVVTLNGEPAAPDPELPLVAGDAVRFMETGATSA